MIPRDLLRLLLLIIVGFNFLGCGKKDPTNYTYTEVENQSTIFERFPAPPGYQKELYTEGSWARFLQTFKLKNSTAQVLDYTGKPISDQRNHVAVLDIDVGTKDLQQCADAIIRLRAEYLWEIGKKDQISFKFTSGHAFSWQSYSEGFRPEVRGNQVSFIKNSTAVQTYESFRKYLDIIFMYAGTISLHRDLKAIDRRQTYEIGDVIVHPGSPGHAVVIVDKATDAKGASIYLLAQGYTPAQSPHILKSGHKSISPWFKIPATGPFIHPRFYLTKPGVRRFI